MIALLLALTAFAQDATPDTVESPEACPFTPIATPPPTRPPDALAPSRDFVECIVTAEVDGSGRPAPKAVEGCEEPFASAARAGFSTWRFKPCVLTDGRPVEGTIRVAAKFASSEFQLQGDDAIQALKNKHQSAKAVKEGCAASFRLVPDGTLTELASSDLDHCLASPPDRTLKHYHLELKRKTTCTVTMTVSKSKPDVDGATVEGCKDDVGRYAINAVTSFPWNSPIGGSEQYTVSVTLGPE